MAEDTFSEFGKNEALETLYKDSGFRNVQTPSFIPQPDSQVSTATRVFIEGIDFDLTYFPLTHLGYKCAVAVTGELLASMSHPRFLSIRLGISAKLDFSHIKDFWSGLTTAAKEQGYQEVGDRKSVV